MTFTTRINITFLALGATLIAGVITPSLAVANDKVTVYFTRHAEKQALLTDAGDGRLFQPEGEKGAEELNEFGEQRASELADWFYKRGFTSELTHIFSSQKLRTRQTIAAIAEDALGMNDENGVLVTANDIDYLPGDGIQQFPVDTDANNYEGRLETLDSPSSSVDPTVEAIMNLPSGSVALVAMHSGTFYKILDGLGIDNSVSEPTDDGLFPKKADGKISTFGDVWKVVIKNGVGDVRWRKNLQFKSFGVDTTFTD